MIGSFPKTKRPTSYFHLFTLIMGILLATSCGPNQKERDTVAEVIGSLTDSLPVVGLPEDADAKSEDWNGADLAPKPPVKPLYPKEEAQHFILPEGYEITPVLTEPQIEQPGAISFDGNGRMYVLELRTYMLTADSEGTLEPVSRISRWEDLDNDGVYEKGTTFVDSLIFPRFVLPYGKDAVLTMESDADEVFKYSDTNGDGVADKKEFFTNKYGRSGNVEHQQAFMYYNMDNWLYSTVNAFRVRETPAGVIRENTGYNRAQWGVTHDDDGKLWFQGGASGLPSYFQFPIHYGNFKVEDQFAEGFDVPWGAPVKIADMQGGMDQVRQPDGSLNRVTGAAGNDIYRGDRLPRDLYGQYFYGEPVARIVRQVHPEVSEGLTTLHNVYQNEESEFLKSTDPLFRPVDMTTAPDGTLYITDMYHGIIQEGQWAQKGSYLRTKIEQYQLDKVVGLGRIWRITHKDMDRDKTRPQMFNESPAELTAYLDHPNGWWRDKAQQLIVLAQDGSITPTLEDMALNHTNSLARMHAIWCLEGLGTLTTDLLSQLLRDKEPRIKIQALRASESLYKKGRTALQSHYAELLQDPTTEVVIQSMLSGNALNLPNWDKQITETMQSHTAKGVQVVGEQILNPVNARGFGTKKKEDLSPEQLLAYERGATIFNELCAQCHGNDGSGTLLGNGQVMAPALAGSVRVQGHPDYTIKTLLHGLEGPLDGKTYPGGIMVGMKEQSDQWIADIVTYIRTNLSNDAGAVSPADVARVRQATSMVEGPYTYTDLGSSVPQILKADKNWGVTASHSAPTRIGGTNSPLSAFNFEGWTTGEQQQKGMWFQVEFPALTNISEIQFNATPISRGWRPGSPPPLHTYPRNYVVKGSVNGQDWKVLHAGMGQDQDMSIAFASTQVKYIRMELTQDFESEHTITWAMRQLRIYGTAPKQNENS